MARLCHFTISSHLVRLLTDNENEEESFISLFSSSLPIILGFNGTGTAQVDIGKYETTR